MAKHNSSDFGIMRKFGSIIITLVFLTFMSYVQIVLAIWIQDLLSAYQGKSYPDHLEEGWFVIIYGVILASASLISYVIYSLSRIRLNRFSRTVLTILPYVIPLVYAHYVIFNIAAGNQFFEDLAFPTDSRTAAWFSSALIAIFLIFQSTIPHWIREAFLSGNESAHGGR